MTTPKEKAQKRLQDKWKKAQKEKDIKSQEYKQEKVQIAKTIDTPGWKILVKSLERTVLHLKEELSQVSAFRVLKGIEIRSEIKSLSRVLLSMQRSEKIHLSDKLILKE